jgi:hypothetical protein
MRTVRHLFSALSGGRSRGPQGLSALTLAVALVGCGGGGNPLGNPSSVNNPVVASGQKLSFAYFQRCINPIFLAQLQISINGVVSTNTCASSGCHDNTNGTGGAFRVVGAAQPVDVTNPANTPEAIRTSDMFKNFFSAQAETVSGGPAQSRLLNKPLVRGVLHGGGLIFANDQDPNARLISFWINNPVPQGQDEFSTASFGLFTPNDPNTGACNTQ